MSSKAGPFLLVLSICQMLITEVRCSHCDHSLYEPVADCSSHALRVGYYPSPACGNLHILTDSDGQPNANFARLNDPASYDTGSGTRYHEYVAGNYLSVKLVKQAHIHGIALQGSPNNLRYYLRSFQISYKVTLNSFDTSQPSITTLDFYKENGEIKQFGGEMQNVTKFVLANPFFADEVRIYPLSSVGNRAFRVELFGCYLGRISVPSSIGMNLQSTFISTVGQSNTSAGSQYFVKILEPNGTVSLLSINGSTNYTFVSRGEATVVLGVKIGNSWLNADKLSDFIVQGPILGLQIKFDNNVANPYKKIENNDIQFQLQVNEQSYQMKRTHFDLGDSKTCDYNYCRNKYPRGIYYIIGTASNDFYQESVHARIVACPNAPVSVAYTPTVHAGGIGIKYKGKEAYHSFTIQFYALWTTTYEVRFDDDLTQSMLINATGLTTKTIALPAGRTAPSQFAVVFNYTDFCETRSYPVTVFLDDVIEGISIRLNQTYKEQLITPVSYYFKDKPVDIYLDIDNGTTVQCQVTISDGALAVFATSVTVTDKVFLKTFTFSSPGDTFPTISASCSNRLNLPAVVSPPQAFDFRQIPEPMTNFSLSLSESVVATGETFFLDIIFSTGTGMNCSVNSSTAGFFETYAYSTLIASQFSNSVSSKAYRISLSTNVYSSSHAIQVACYTVIKRVVDEINFEAQIPVSGLSIIMPNFACFDTSFSVQSLVAQGKPVTKSLKVNVVPKMSYPSSLEKDNTFVVGQPVYVNPGVKTIDVHVWNTVTSSQMVTKYIRIARNISNLDIGFNFTLSSSQAMIDRPDLVLPANELITFEAIVTPKDIGYLYNWELIGNTPYSKQESVPKLITNAFSHHGDTGSWLVKLTANGCNDVVVQRNITVVSPISEFSVTTIPNPEVVVNKSTTIRIGFAANAHCLKVDFGDGTSTLQNCKNNTAPHALSCFTLESVCSVNHVYASKGLFTIKVVAFNGLFQMTKQTAITAKTCYNPLVTMQGDGSDISDFVNNVTDNLTTTKLYRSSSFFYNVTSIVLNCEFTNAYSTMWKIYSAPVGSNADLMWNDPSLLMSNALFTFRRGGHSMTVPCCFLPYGAFTVSLEVSVTGHALTNSFKTIKAFSVSILHTDLVPRLERTEFRVYGFNTMITVNGSQSYDPDKFSNDLEFTWYCRDTNLEPRDLSIISSFLSLNHTDVTLSQPVTGCFGSPVGMISVAKSMNRLNFNSKHLQENHTIEITMVVKNTTSLGVRTSNLSRTFLVLTKETPYLEIKCTENCGKKMNPTSRFSLVVDCYGDACLQAPQYKWALIEQNATHNISVELESKLHSFVTEKDLRMKPNVLDAGTSYTLILRGTGKGGAFYDRKYSFITNEGPKNGKCTVSRTSGVAVYQRLTVNCAGWSDTDLPLSYEISIVNSIMATIICNTPYCVSSLPSGHPDNSTLIVRARVYDSLNTFTDVESTVRIYSSSCNQEIYGPVSNCAVSPLRIGHYETCGELHSLTDSDGKPNAQFARLRHPAIAGSNILEYSAGEYLAIKLSRLAHIHGVALQGSPDNLRYYVTAFELWYKTVTHNLDITQPSTTVENHYKEGGIKKIFSGLSRNVTMLKLANPFYSDELRVYPVSYNGGKVFRVELFGCYLGRINITKPVVVNTATRISFQRAQNTNTSGDQYYIKITEPDGTAILMGITDSSSYNFSSHGKARVELGLKYDAGWVSVDYEDFTVLGPIAGWKMLMDGYSLTPYKRTTFKDILFSLNTDSQPYQATSIIFNFGDSSNCSYNNCWRNLPAGLYNVKGTASNAAFQQSVYKHVISCPLSELDVSFTPALHEGGIGIAYLGPTAGHNFKIRHFALWVTRYDVYFDGVRHQNGTLNGTGWIKTELNYSQSNLLAPSSHSLAFNYTDACATWNKTAVIHFDEKITDLTLQINQTFKLQLVVQPIPYIFKNHSVVFQFKMKNGTSVKCFVSINETSINQTTVSLSTNVLSKSITVTNKQFTVTHTFTSQGDTIAYLSAKCWNRLKLPDVILSTSFEVQKVPEVMTNFSLDVNKRVLNSSELFYLYLLFDTGERMTCNVTSNSTGIINTYSYEQLISNQQPHSGSRKSYSLPLIAETTFPTLLLYVACQNVHNEVRGNITLNVSSVPLQGLTFDIQKFACYGSTIAVQRYLTKGSPIYDSIYINNKLVLKKLTYQLHETHSIGPALYGLAGLKDFVLRTANSENSLQGPMGQIRISMSITTLDVATSFTLSSPQGLSARPNLTIPLLDTVHFTAMVTPNASGYIYNWQVDEAKSRSNHSSWSYSFPSIGTYIFKLKVEGCNNVSLEKNLTVVSPIAHFRVTTDPTPECVVNKTATISIQNARHSECLELDFGDGTSKMTHCKSNETVSVLSCFTLGSVCEVQHIYRKGGTFKIKVTASNGLFTRIIETTVVAKTCYDPVFALQGNGTEVARGFSGLSRDMHLLRLHRSLPLIFNITTVNINCEFSTTYSVRWTVFSLGINSTINQTMLETQGQAFVVANSSFSFNLRDHMLYIPCCFMTYGDVIVAVDLKMSGHYLINRIIAKKVFKISIRDTDLVPVLGQRTHSVYPYNTTVTVNASLSYDPDRFSSNLSYTWYCRDTSLESRDVSTISNLPRIDSKYFFQGDIQPNRSINKTIQLVSSTRAIGFSSNVSSVHWIASHTNDSQANQELIGCFGKAAGIIDLPKTEKAISFNSKFLHGNHTIEFTVVVEADTPFRTRRSSTKRTLLVALPLTPFFDLRCIENCAKKIDASHKFSLVTICKGGACYSNSTFKWKMEHYNDTARRSVPLQGLLYSTVDSKNLYMKPNVLTPGLNYSLVLRATAVDGSYFEQQFLMAVNIAPRNGSCIVSPKRGLAIYKRFDINCTGWIDTERPLTYEVAHISDVLTTVVCRQYDENCRTILPVGSNSNSSLLIRIRIVDNMNMFTELYHTVHMDVPTSTMAQLNDFLNTIENATDGQEIAQYIGAVASMLNLNAETNRTDTKLQKKIQIRNAAMNILLRMVSSSSDDVIAPLIALLAEVPSEFSQASGVKATDAIDRMASNLIAESKSVLFRDLVSRGKSLIAAMGMTMKSTSTNLDPNLKAKNESNFTENPLEWVTAQGRNIVLTNLKYVEGMTDVVLARMSLAEEAVKILTSNIGLELEKRLGSAINGTMNKQLMDGRIILPSLTDMNLNSELIVNSVMKYTTFNSFFWQFSCKLINSSLIDFKLKTDSSLLQVSGTKKPIQISVPRKLARPVAYEHWTFQERYQQERKNFHAIKIEHDNSLHMEFKPMNYCFDYQLFVKYGSRPSRDDYYKNWTLPDLSTCGSIEVQDRIRANMCLIYREIANKALRNQLNPLEPTLNCTLRELLDGRIENLLKPCSLYPYRIFLLDTETKNGTYYVGIFEKNGTVSVNASVPQLLNDTMKCQVDDVINQTSYFIRSFTSKCRFWDESKKEEWETHGCQVGPHTNASMVECNCNHLTSFASDFLIAPNPIDIDKVIEGFKNIHDNVSVLVLISLLLGLYILLVMRLKGVDKMDASKVGVVAIQNEPTIGYQYLIITITGARINAGTTANVFCALNNSERKGEARVLLDMEKPAFQRDQINAFTISYNEAIDDITDIRIWHDNKGESPGWYLSRVYVEDLQTNKTYTFICEQWLAVELEDGLIDRSIGLAGQDDHRIFSHIFTTKTAKDFSDQHLWLSIILKRPHDSFTRVQRVTCCMALLFTTMLASAMFFQLNNQSKYLWKIGSLVIDYKGIIIGIQSGLVILPITSILLAMFRNTESFETYKNRRKKRNLDGKISKRNKALPCGFLVISWSLAVGAILSSCVIVLFYSMQWGNEKSQQFVVSVFTSFFQSAFILQPLKLVVFAIVVAAIFKRNQDEYSALEIYKFSSNVQNVDLSNSDIDIPNLAPKPLTAEQRKYARKRRLMEMRMRIFLQDFLSYAVFLLFLGFVVRGYRDNDGYYFSKALTDDIVHQHFERVQDVPGIWSWVQNHFIPAIYTKEWYNGDNFSDFKMTRNQDAYRIGLARIRQVRVKYNACSLPDDVKGIADHCNEDYSFQANDERHFDVGWKSLTRSRRRRLVPYENADERNEKDVLEVHDDFFENFKLRLRDPTSTTEILNNARSQRIGIDEQQFVVELQGDRNEENRLANVAEILKLKKFVYAGNNEFTSNFDSNYDDILGSTIESRNLETTDYDNALPWHDSSESDINSQDSSHKGSLDYEQSFEDEKILRRNRRALKFKINRKTIPSTTSLEHPNEVIIDSQYLLPDGRVRPNKDHWIYRDMSSLRGFPYYGKIATYSGGGYVASLATDIDFARATAMALEQDSWIDTLTRAVFFEFSVYNANLNFFATGFVIAEVLPTGNVYPSASIRVFKLYRYVGVFGKLVMASEIILVLCLLFFIYKECRQMYRMGCAYLKSFWSWVEITIAVALFTAIILRGFSWYEADKNLTLFRKQPEKFISFHYTVVADEALLVSITVICFASTLKMMKIIAFFPTIVALNRTLFRCFKPLLNFALPFAVAFCGFATLAHLLFHNTTLFYSYVKTVETQLLMLIGGSVYYTLRDSHEILGPLFFSLFAAFETCVMLNVFLSIINDGIAESAHWNGDFQADEFVDFVEERTLAMLRAFSSSLKQTTASSMNLFLRKDTQRIEVGESTENGSGNFLKTSLASFGNSMNDKTECRILDNKDLVLKRLENKLTESFEIEKDDTRYLLRLLVALKTKQKLKRTNNLKPFVNRFAILNK